MSEIQKASDIRFMEDYADHNEMLTLRVMMDQGALSRDQIAGLLARTVQGGGRSFADIEADLDYLSKKGWIDTDGSAYVINESGTTKLGPMAEQNPFSLADGGPIDPREPRVL